MRCVVAGSYRKFLGKMMSEVAPVFERVGIEVVYPKNSDIINPGAPFPLMRHDMLTPEQTQEKIREYASSRPNGYSDPTVIFALLAQERQEKGLPLDDDMMSSVIAELNFVRAALHSDFVYAFNPKGYIGMSTSFELAYLIGSKVPVYALEKTAPRRERHLDAAVRMQQGKKSRAAVRDFLQWDITREVMWRRWMDEQIETTGGFFDPEQLVEHLYSTGCMPRSSQYERPT